MPPPPTPPARGPASLTWWGFQSLSKMITVSADWRFSPSPPARVLSRKMKYSEPGSLKVFSSMPRSSAFVVPAGRGEKAVSRGGPCMAGWRATVKRHRGRPAPESRDSASTRATEASRANSAVTPYACLGCDEQPIQVYGEHEPMPCLPPQEMKRTANRPLTLPGVTGTLL